MTLFKKLNLSLLFLSLLLIFSCSNNNNSGDTSSMSVKLVDNPGDFDHFFIEVIDVMVKVNDDSEDEDGWESLDPINTGVYDLLELTGGINVLLVDDFQVPSGTLNQIRLVLGEDNSVVMEGETYPLNTPSAQQSGLKIKVNETLEPDFTYEYVLDFDVDESIVIAGNSGNINLKPVIRATAEVSSGKIEGIVTPMGYQVTVSVVVEDEEISAYTDENGNYCLYGVPEGTYSLLITPDPESGYSPIVVNDIIVVNGEITTVSEVTFE